MKSSKNDLARAWIAGEIPIDPLEFLLSVMNNETLDLGLRRMAANGLRPFMPSEFHSGTFTVSRGCAVCGKLFSFLWTEGSRGRHKKICDACRSDGISQVQHANVCECCGNSFSSRLKEQKFCSQKCAKRSIGNAARKWPSKQDARRYRSHIRRVRIKNAAHEKFTHAEIFERDGYKCGICGGMTDTSADADRHFKPSLDHVIPLANGGSHTRANVQCAHWICNSRKSCY